MNLGRFLNDKDCKLDPIRIIILRKGRKTNCRNCLLACCRGHDWPSVSASDQTQTSPYGIDWIDWAHLWFKSFVFPAQTWNNPIILNYFKVNIMYYYIIYIYTYVFIYIYLLFFFLFVRHHNFPNVKEWIFMTRFLESIRSLLSINYYFDRYLCNTQRNKSETFPVYWPHYSASMLTKQ